MFRVNMILSLVAVLASASFCIAAENEAAAKKKKILFFSPSFGFRHSVVARPLTGELSHAEKTFKEFATKAGYEVSFSQDCHDLNNDGAFKRFDAVLFYTTGNPPINRDALLKFVREGGTFIGIHTATDTFHSDGNCGPKWPEYTKMVGGAFKTHGRTHDLLPIKNEDPASPITKMIPADWKIGDEIYQFKEFSRDNCHVLLSIDTEKADEKALAGHNQKKGEDYPVAWTRAEGKGRVFYTSLGHREDVWTNPVYQEHVLAGIAWAMGEKDEK